MRRVWLVKRRALEGERERRIRGPMVRGAIAGEM